MKVGIAVFAYNRPEHLQKVLDGLKENDGVNLLYIFHDGLKCEADRDDWQKTRNEIDGIDWCNVRLYASDVNKGLAESIVDGINTVFKENDAIIVLEDDCVPQAAFVSFMVQCFEQYENDKKIYSVSGYSWPIGLEQKEYDICFCGRPCPWGWGTWKDRWVQYRKDYNMIIDINQDMNLSKNLAIWGDDLEDMLVSNIRGMTNSWYVFWSLLIIKNNGYAINPYKSLIKNEGFDGTGVHCGKTNRFDIIELDNRHKSDQFILPMNIEINVDIKKAFRDLYGSFSIKYDDNSSKTDILIYGIGKYYISNAQLINSKFNVIAFVDKYKKNKYYAGIEIIHPKQICEKVYKYIVIMIENKTECNLVKTELGKIYGVEVGKIKLGYEL